MQSIIQIAEEDKNQEVNMYLNCKGDLKEI